MSKLTLTAFALLVFFAPAWVNALVAATPVWLQAVLTLIALLGMCYGTYKAVAIWADRRG